VENVEMAQRDIDVGHDVYIGFNRPNIRHHNGDQWLWTVSEKQDDVFIVTNGKVGIGTHAPDAAAVLDIKSTDKGFLPPRMSSAQMNAISSPPAGLMIFNTTLNSLCFYDGTSWNTV